MGNYSGVGWFLRRSQQDQFLTLFLLKILMTVLGGQGEKRKEERKEGKNQREIMTEKLKVAKDLLDQAVVGVRRERRKEGKKEIKKERVKQ